MSAILSILGYALLPTAAGAGGGLIATLRPPSGKVRSLIQHFAAGVVFAVAAVELLPDIVKRHLAWEVGLGFAAGVAVMLALKQLGQRLERNGGRRGVTQLLGAVGIDVGIDGILLGIGFAAGAKEGVLLTFALTMELLSLGLASGVGLRTAGYSRRGTFTRILAVSSLLLVGAGLGATLLHSLPPAAMELTLAFGLAALLYLVTEELLVEAHEEPENPRGNRGVFWRIPRAPSDRDEILKPFHAQRNPPASRLSANFAASSRAHRGRTIETINRRRIKCAMFTNT